MYSSVEIVLNVINFEIVLGCIKKSYRDGIQIKTDNIE
jgi:hypothetical protein